MIPYYTFLKSLSYYWLVTWSGIAHFHDQITNVNYMAQCGNHTNGHLRLPKNFMLFASPGIGAYWNQTGKAFSNLLKRNLQIGNLTLTTIVFSADDVNSGTIKFARSQMQANTTKIGCLVDITSLVSYGTTSAPAIIEFVKQKCHSILDESTFLVWQIQIDNKTKTETDFTYNSDQNNLKSNLIKMLIARQLYKNTNPNQEILFRVYKPEETMDDDRYKRNLTRCLTFTEYSESKYLDKLLLKWGALHKVKIMTVMPAFDLKSQLMGHSFLPFETEEQLNKRKSQNC